MNKLILPVAALLLITSACDQAQQNDELDNKTYTDNRKEQPDTSSIPDTKKVPVEVKKEKTIGAAESSFLNNFDAVQTGTSFLNVKELFPSAPAPQSKAGASSPYIKESKSQVPLFDQSAQLHFLFKNDSLSGYYLTITESDFEKAEELHDLLNARYTARLGNCTPEKVEEENRFLNTCYWTNKGKTLTFTYDINAGKIILHYQQSK